MPGTSIPPVASIYHFVESDDKYGKGGLLNELQKLLYELPETTTDNGGVRAAWGS